ncbi:MAG: CHAT domain-containing protein, partial [Saprospiraceae bacterium]|nr:CHAT domain-containing protein [Saprospiraceae bacterium]
FKDIKQYDQSELFLLKALEIQEKAFGKNTPRIGTNLANLAALYKEMGQYEKSEKIYLKTLNLFRKHSGENHTSVLLCLSSLADLGEDKRDYDMAWNYIDTTIFRASSLDLGVHISKGWADSLYQASFPSNEHIRNLLIALDIGTRLLEKDKRIKGAKEKKLIILDLANKLTNKWINDLSSEEDKLKTFIVNAYWLQNNLNSDHEADYASRAFELADENKSVLLLKATKSEDAYRLGALPDSLVKQNKTLHQKRSRLKAQLLEKRSDDEKMTLRDQLNSTTQAIDNFDNAIKRDFPKYYRLKYKTISTEIEKIQEQLLPNTAMLEYAITDSVLHLFMVEKSNVKWIKKRISRRLLKKKIKALHHCLSDYVDLMKDEKKSYVAYTQLAYWFYQNILEAVLPNDQSIRNLVVIPDGELGHLPFEVFLTQPASKQTIDYKSLHYLVNDFSITYNYSAGLWLENMAQKQGKVKYPGQLLGICANYEANLDSNLMQFRLPTEYELREQLTPLPAAREEVQLLRDQFKGFFAFDTLATEQTIKERATDYSILHLAVHGILDEKRPVLSSLALSENGDSLENNFWQAHEISKMELNADLVVLSACETGYGRFETGNGIASLARSFMYAGASSLVVSLWQVNDLATSIIMQNLYNNLVDGMAKDEALSKAKLDYIVRVKGIAA